MNRTAGNAQIFMDGVLNSYFDASNVGGFSATQLYAGARRWTEAEQIVNHTDMHLDGAIDELRIWNMALPASTVSNNYNISPEGTEMGLMMYLPFSKYITNSANIQELVYSGDDLVTDSTLVTLEKAVATSEVPPVCKKAPETSIPFTFVVNKDGDQSDGHTRSDRKDNCQFHGEGCERLERQLDGKPGYMERIHRP